MTAPPPLFFSYPTSDAFLSAAADQLPEDEINLIRILSASGLPPVSSVHCLSLLTGYSPGFIGTLAKRSFRYYRKFSVRHGKHTRIIQSPRVGLKVLQRWFGWHLARSVHTPSHVHGFVPGRSTVSAAAAHCKANWILSLDVRGFFPSITMRQVHDALKLLSYPGSAAWLMAELCTLDGRLPQGSPASPVLSNLAFADTDERLRQLAESKQLRLTRYADDIALSGTSAVPPGLLEEVAAVITNGGWQLANEKTELVVSPDTPRILGLIVDKERPRLNRRYRHKLRMMKYMLDKGEQLDRRASFEGHVSYSKSIV